MAINLTFSGAGFLGIYQAGVVACLTSYGKKLKENIKYFGGCSAGAMNAVNLLCGIKMEQGLQLFMETAAKIRDTTLLGPFTAPFDPVTTIKQFYSINLSPDAYKTVSGRLFISLTRVSDWKNVIVSEFESNRELIDALACTTFIPFYSGVKPPKYRGVSYVDGSFSDNLLQHFEGTNITVSVFSGDSDICPDDGQKSNIMFDMKNATVELTGHNAYRLLKALFPLNSAELTELCRQGFRDTLKYLNSKYPEMLSFDVDIVSVPYCCGGTFTENGDQKRDLTCWCGTSENDDSTFSEMEKEIAREKVIKSLVVPEDFYRMLSEVENIMGEKDYTYHAVTTMLQLVKWLAYPNYYATNHIYHFVDDLFRFLLPVLQTYSSKNMIVKNIFKMAEDAYSAYHGTGQFEWHPTLGEEKRTDIDNTRKRLASAQRSFVALHNPSVTSLPRSVSSDGSDLSLHARSRGSSVFSDDVFEDVRLRNEVDEDDKYSTRGFRFLAKMGSALFSKTVTEDDYGNDLDYSNCDDDDECSASGDDEQSSPIWF